MFSLLATHMYAAIVLEGRSADISHQRPNKSYINRCFIVEDGEQLFLSWRLTDQLKKISST
jgi:hypothetical protein